MLHQNQSTLNNIDVQNFNNATDSNTFVLNLEVTQRNHSTCSKIVQHY